MTRILNDLAIAAAMSAVGAMSLVLRAAVAVAGMLGAFESEPKREDCTFCWNRHEDCRRCAARRKR